MDNAILKLTNLLQKVALKESPAEQMRLIVDTVIDLINVDVCSLYRMQEDGSLHLVASFGLRMTENVVIPPGLGIAGEVVKLRHSVNLDNAEDHPGYFYIPQTKEERYHGYCGVPLVYLGQVIGVLVVQSLKKGKLSTDVEAFLVTLASQLAMILGVLPSVAIAAQTRNIRKIGVKASSGVAIGRVKFCATEEFDLQNVVDEGCEDVVCALQEWQELIKLVSEDIKNKQLDLGDELSAEVSGIFDAYTYFLSDPAFSEKVESKIRAGGSLPAALKSSVQYFSDAFRAMDDAYLRARFEDVEQLGNKLYLTWKLRNAKSTVALTAKDMVVLVGKHVSVFDVASIPVKKLAGIVSYEGTSLSHSAVLANALGIPAVMGTGTIQNLQAGDEIIVDGNTGKVILFPTSTLVSEYRQIQTKARRLKKQLSALKDEPAITLDGHRVVLLANTGLHADLSPGLENGAEGIGLYRTEVLFMSRSSFPSESDQIESYRTVLDAYQSKPVYMRTLDVGGDKPLPYFQFTDEENPALGWRGVRFTLDNIQLLMTQVRAMLVAAGNRQDLHIIVPMVTSTEEIKGFRQLVSDACEQLAQENITHQRPKIGIMIEVPAAISQLPLWSNDIDFVSIGSNDLSQYLLALDRNNRRVANRYDPVHPAILQEIHRICDSAKSLNMPLSLCGEMANDPVSVFILLGFGVRQLSLNSSHIPEIKALIRSVPVKEAELTAQRCLKLNTVEQIRQTVVEKLRSLGLDEMLG